MPVNKNIYNVNWNKLVSWLLPNELFKPKMFAWCKSLVVGVSSLHTLFLQFRKQTNYHLSITGQITKLVLLLNDKYDKTQRRIYITDGQRGDEVYIFLENEVKDLSLYTTTENQPIYIFNSGEVGANKAHFIVHVPLSIQFDEAAMRALINIYKIPGKRYQIQKF
jgi:hypothetical protein